MSASTEKKNRRSAREAGTDKKTLAAQEEAKKKAKSQLRWTLGTIAVVVLIVAVIFLNSSLLYTITPAVSVAGESYSAAEVSYYFGTSFYTWANQYGSYASIFGLDTSGGIYGLDSQSCPMLENGSWRDYFLDSALAQISQTQALCAYAADNGIALTEDEQAEVQEQIASTEDYARSLGYSGAGKFLASNYGRGVTLSMAEDFALRAELASKTLNTVQDSLQYSDQELEDYYQSLNGESDVFDFIYYYDAADTVETQNEDGETVNEATEETIAASKALAEDIMASYEELVAASEDAEPDYAALFEEAVAANVEDGTATHPTTYTGSSLGDYKDFLMDAQRKAGDVTAVENTNADGWYTVVFLGRDDNHYPTAKVRHILVMAEASEDGTYSDEAKEAAKTRAEEILAEWKAGEATEESFAALAEEYSEDTGSNTNGGLYEDIYKGQMVEEFDEFCFAGHEPGDTAVVYGESSGYAGYHVIYYVGEGPDYSDVIARNDLVSQDMQSWLDEQLEGYDAQRRYGLRLVG